MEENGKATTDVKPNASGRSRSPRAERSNDKDRSTRSKRGTSSTSGRDRSRNRSRDKERDRSARRLPTTKRIYVANIAYDCKWTDVKDLFRDKIGDVAFVQLFSDENDKFRGCGIVEMKDSSSVQKAVEILHRYEYKGRQLVVKEDFDVERDKYGHPITRSSAIRQAERDRERDMEENYSRQRDRGDRERDGGGDGGGRNNDFNNYGLNPDFLASLNITGPLTNKVFVANLEYKVDGKKLEEVFSCAGTVIDVDLKTDLDGNSKGHAVVEFAHPIEAVQAISMLNGQKLFSRSMNMRMDRYNEDSDRSSSKLPSGLSGVGKGLGVDGMPLHLSRLNNLNNLGMAANPLAALGMGSANTSSVPGALGLIGNASLSNLAGISGLASTLNSMSGMGLPGIGLNMGMGSNSTERSLMGQGGLGASSLSTGMANSMSGSLAASMGLGAASSLMGGSGSGGGSSGLGNAMGGLGMGMSSSGMMGANSLSQSMSGNSSMGALGPSNSNMMGNSGLSGTSPLGNSNSGYSNSNYDRGSSAVSGSGGGGYDRSSGNDNFNRSPRSSDTIVVRNLPSTFGWQTLRDRFREIGEIRFTEIKGRGSAVVRFASERDAQRAVDLMNGIRVDGRPIEVQLY